MRACVRACVRADPYEIHGIGNGTMWHSKIHSPREGGRGGGKEGGHVAWGNGGTRPHLFPVEYMYTPLPWWSPFCHSPVYLAEGSTGLVLGPGEY